MRPLAGLAASDSPQLAAAMRVASGQIPHRDFYANYGPAQFYILAGLFHAFGTSILVERLFDLLIKALLITAVYAIASLCCRPLIAAGTSAATFLWVFGVMNEQCGFAITPVSPSGSLRKRAGATSVCSSYE